MKRRIKFEDEEKGNNGKMIIKKQGCSQYEILALKPLALCTMFLTPDSLLNLAEDEDFFDFRPRVFLKIKCCRVVIPKTFSFIQACNQIEEKQGEVCLLMKPKPVKKEFFILKL